MNKIFDGTVTNNLKNSPNTSVTVFKKKEERWEKLLDPFYFDEEKKEPTTQNLPKIESWRETVTIRIALNHPIDKKTCKVNKIENGTNDGPNKVDNFVWDVDVTAKDNKITVEIEVAEGE
jgi:hypothetical protein